MRTRLLALTLALCALTAGDLGAAETHPGRTMLRLPVSGAPAGHVNVALFVPPSTEEPANGFPLILFLHGSEQRGDNPALLDDLPILDFTEEDAGFPFVTVVPQCPSGTTWSPGVLKQVLDAVEAMVPVDRERVYLTGFSMGGFGTWQTAAAFPGIFAAIAPLCGFSDIPDAPVLAAIPVWAFHGAQDRNIPVTESERMIATLRREGADAQLTVYPDLAHDCWTMTYHDSRLYLWFLSHVLGAPSASGR